MMQMIGQRIMFDMRMQIYTHLQRLDLSFYDRNPVGRLMTRVTTDVDVINDLFTSGVVAAFGDLFMLVGIMVTLLWMDWRLALIAFSVLPLILVLAQWFRRNVRESYRKVRLRIARINAFLNEHINGMATVQLFRREEVNYGRFELINREHRDANVEQIFFYAVFLPAVEFVAAIATALILWYGGGFVMNGTLTLGSLVAFILYAGRFFRPISDMSEKFNTLQAAMASSERIFQLLDTEVAVKEPAGQRAKTRAREARGHIVFENVSFAYKDDDYVLQERLVRSEARRARRHRRRDGRGEVDAHQPAAAVLRRHERPHSDRRRRHPRDGSRARCGRCSASCCRTCICFPARLPATSGSATTQSMTRACAKRRERSTRIGSSSRFPAATTRASRSGARRCRSGRSSCCRLRARWRSIRRC